MPAKTAQAGLYSIKSGCEHTGAQPLFYARALFFCRAISFARSDTDALLVDEVGTRRSQF
jgi:hypothetical protein